MLLFQTAFYIGSVLISSSLKVAVARLSKLTVSLSCFAKSRETKKVNEARALQLLRECLSPQQRIQFAEIGEFVVVGCHTRALYTISLSRLPLVTECAGDGNPIAQWCFRPAGDLPLADVALGQKMALEHFEQDALRIANKVSCQHGSNTYFTCYFAFAH